MSIQSNWNLKTLNVNKIALVHQLDTPVDRIFCVCTNRSIKICKLFIQVLYSANIKGKIVQQAPD